MKYMSHHIQKDLEITHPHIHEIFKVDLETKQYYFWQRDSMPIQLYMPKVEFRKSEYVHNNPLHGKWSLAKSPGSYVYSSAHF